MHRSIYLKKQKRKNAWRQGVDTRKGEVVLREGLLQKPLWAVPKNQDPMGRIIHDYSIPFAVKVSVSSDFINTSVQYISFVERTEKLSKVDWFIKVDMKNGDQQLGVHPSEKFTQVYSLGKKEFYIDQNLPFDKANSSKIFSRWTTEWCEAFSKRFHEKFIIPIILESYVDDFFGGPKRSKTGAKTDKQTAEMLFENLITAGELSGSKMNIDKCYSPTQEMEILGFVYDAITKS